MLKPFFWRLLRDSYLVSPLSGLLVLFCLMQVGLSMYLPVLVGQAIDRLLLSDFSQGLRVVLVRFFVVILLNTLCLGAIPLITNRIVLTYIANLRQEAMSKIHQLSMEDLNGLSKGDLVSRLTADSEQINTGLVMVCHPFLTGCLLLLATLIGMLRIDVFMLSLVLLLTPLSLFIARFIAKRSYAFHQAQVTARGKQTELLEEAVSQVDILQHFEATTEVHKELVDCNQTYTHNALKAIFYGSMVNPSTRFINAITYALLLVIGLYRIASGTFSVGRLITFLTYAQQYSKPFNDVSTVLSEWQQTMVCSNRLYTLLDMPIPSHKTKQLVLNGGQVTFEEVTFSYDNRKPLLEKLSFHIPSGSRVAIVGPTGSGKSTLVNLLMGIYGVCQGRILIDGQDISQLNQEHLAQHFGLVSQMPWLKEASIHDNIAYGQPHASRQAVIAAAQEVGADFFIRQLPMGYDTVLTDNAAHLSQGQGQLLTIARIVLKNPQILVLDEATSAIDSRTENLIQTALDKLMIGRTSFIIAHRLSTVLSADLILVLVDGQLIEYGNHKELMAAKGYYYRMQTGDEK